MGDAVLDPFLGSSSTLIAAEKTGRVCRGVELDPLYVDVIIRRYEVATGKAALLAETCETFATLAARRDREERERPQGRDNGGDARCRWPLWRPLAAVRQRVGEDRA